MTASNRSIRFLSHSICKGYEPVRIGIAALLLLLPVLSLQAQTTTISGTVYDPRTQANGGLPLPGVLVYATTGSVAPLTAGVQCLTSSSSAPTGNGIVSFTNSAVDGTFTLTNVPENATYTVVIQAGKWRRQFTEAVATGPLTGIELDMPANHTQGDIPLIAIATGSVDALECVLHDMGIADTEFTDDNGTSGGRIHLYTGSSSPGAAINASTPTESVLMTNSATLNNYDVVMFPCQGGPDGQATPAGATNLLNYANAGGRVFATHFSYAWLNPGTPYDSDFPPVANWGSVNAPVDGPATINTGFNDGATLAQWLLNSGASTTYGQVDLANTRNDLASIIPPTQSWATLNSSNDIMQMTFNAPVGAPAANQCGRVLFNEYHVYPPRGSGTIFPAECGASAPMTPQEEMLEYALYDLSSFVTPVVVPTLSITFNPSPLVVDQGENGDTLTVNVTNTSTTTPIDSTPLLTLTLPAGLTATALTDPTGGWICTFSSLTCIRAAGIPASASDSVVLTVNVPLYPPGGLASYTGSIGVTVSSANFSNNVTASDTVTFQQPPAITWATPAPIIYGTPLGGAQLNAASTVAGTFSYSPSAGTVLGVGAQTLKVLFTPADTTHYTTSTASVTLTVIPATPSVTVSSSPNPVFLSNPVTLTATISALAVMPTGSVTFFDGTTQVGTGTVSAGIATCTTSALTTGTHSITAVYSGDSSYGPATSGMISEAIQDFTFAESGSSVTAGPVTTYPLLIAPVGGATLAGAVTMSVAGTPLGVTPVFTPGTVTANSGVTPVTLQMKSPDQLGSRRPMLGPFGGGRLPVALGIFLLPFAALMRKTASRWSKLMVLALMSAALAVGLSGCGSVVLTPQTSTLTITATSGNLSHSITVNLTVK
jgi:hypothetical protein